MAEEEKKDIKEPWGGRWSTGYRSWKLVWHPEKKEPRLGSVVHSSFWEPGEEGEIVSDWQGEEKEGMPFSRSAKGFCSLKSPKEVKERGYQREGITGAIIPYGEVAYGEMGYRASKAKVSALFRKSVPCYICGQPGKFVVRNDEKFILCERCIKRLTKLIQKKGYTEEDIDDVLKKLAEVYQADIVETWEEE